MPTVVKGAPVASRIPPHESRAKLLPRVVPDEDPAELIRRVIPDENQAKSLCTSLLMSIAAASHHKSLPIRIAAASTRCSARYENRVTPRPIRKTIPPSGLTGKNDTPKQYLRIFRANVIAVGRQPISLGEKCAQIADRRKQTAKIAKKQRFLFLFYHTKAGKATTGRNANMQFVYTAGQAEKQSTVA